MLVTFNEHCCTLKIHTEHRCRNSSNGCENHRNTGGIKKNLREIVDSKVQNNCGKELVSY